METIFAVIATSLTVLGTVSGQDAMFSGNDVHSWCQSDKKLALGYAAGMRDQVARSLFIFDISDTRIDAARSAISVAKTTLVGYCEPPGVTAGQVTDVFCAYLRDAPNRRNVHASLLFNEAMRKAWPCS